MAWAAQSSLVEAARTGDREALTQLLGEHLPLVYNVVGRALHGHADVDDVVQETMLRVVRRLPQLRDPRSFRSWMMAIAIRQIQDRARTVGAESVELQPSDRTGCVRTGRAFPAIGDSGFMGAIPS